MMTSAVIEPDFHHPLTTDRPRVALVSTALPPQLDGIGDYTSRLASAFSTWAHVTVHTIGGFSPHPIPGASVVQSFDIQPRQAVSKLLEALDQDPPDFLVLQYNPFCFGLKGFNPYLGGVLHQLKQKQPRMHLTVMVHERFMPANSPRNLVMWAYQFVQFRAVTSAADLTLFSTGPWFESYRRRHPRRAAGHMPVGSNLPLVQVDRESFRNKLNFGPGALVLGTFGGNHPSRLFGYLAAAGRRLKSLGQDVRVLSIGPAGPAIKKAMADLPVVDVGTLPSDGVSNYLQAVDIYCSPFYDGVSTRRGSFFAGLQHGLATVTSRGYNSDADLLAHADKAFIATAMGNQSEFVEAVVTLATDHRRREQIAAAAKACFDQNYSLPVLAHRWRDVLSSAPRVPGVANPVGSNK